MARVETMQVLFESLQKRLRPEDVAELVMAQYGSKLSPQEFALLKKVASHSLRNSFYAASSMMDEFRKPVAPTRQVKTATEIFKTASQFMVTDADILNPERLLQLLNHICEEIKKTPDYNDFNADRYNRADRKSMGLDLSRRRYNKLFRFLVRFQKKIETYSLELRKYRASMTAKSSLAGQINRDDFFVSEDAACFVAYFTARCNRRSQFTNKSQDKAFDEVSLMLYNRFKRQPRAAGWRVLAHVMPDPEIVSKLCDRDKMAIFNKYLTVMVDIADLLKTTHEKSNFNLSTMVVSRGDDSSTWNAIAGAWNMTRTGWMSLLFALGLQKKFETMCVGKVMRLMAADVVRWHKSSGGDLDPNTAIWANLPFPWEVFLGEKTCTREIVESICKKYNIDAEKTGWIAPKDKREVVEFKPTPELVHGVVVNDPRLATVLRKAGWFSGKFDKVKSVSEAVIVERDETGAALSASSIHQARE